ncbi:glycosyltransferase family 2 protein, partial [Streptomyces sp. SID7760]|nr:glycosyltransferase family 2 protein [Streptomyces sp. SID7760]
MKGTDNGMPKIGVVVLTMGDRPAELGALLDSVAAQDGDPATVVVLSQGVKLPPLPGGVGGVEL